MTILKMHVMMCSLSWVVYIIGRTDSELPETLFACVGANKPQEDRGEFIFAEDQDDE